MPVDLSRTLILNVDDNDAGRYARSRILRREGFRVVEAATGQAALDLVERERPALVLLDVNLPDINGMEVCRRIKDGDSGSTVLVLQISAARVSAADRIRGLDMGADGYLIEPVDPEELLAHVRALLRLNVAERRLAAAAREWQATFEGIGDGVGLLDRGGAVRRCNGALARILERAAEDIVGRPVGELLPGLPWADDPAAGYGRALDLPLDLPRGGRRWCHVALDPVEIGEGGITAVCVVSDITQRCRQEAALRDSLAEKDTLLREIHHRVKNNLQVIWSLLHLEAQHMKDGLARQRLEVVGQRIGVLGRLHEQLYTSENVTRIDVGVHLSELCRNLAQFHHPTQAVTVAVDSEPLCCDLETAIPLGMIANELVSNAFKHAFPEGRGGHVQVTLRRGGDGSTVELTVADNGVGLPAGSAGPPPERRVGRSGPATAGRSGLGMRLVSALAGQIDAQVNVAAADGIQATVTLDAERFPRA